MSSKRYIEEVKIEAVKQVTDGGHGVAGVVAWVNVSMNGNSVLLHYDSWLEVSRFMAKSWWLTGRKSHRTPALICGQH